MNNKQNMKKQLEYDLKYYGIGLSFKEKLRKRILKYWANKRGRVQKKLYKQPQYFLNEGRSFNEKQEDKMQQYKVDSESCNYKINNSIDNIEKKDIDDKNR